MDKFDNEFVYSAPVSMIFVSKSLFLRKKEKFFIPVVLKPDEYILLQEENSKSDIYLFIFFVWIPFSIILIYGYTFTLENISEHFLKSMLSTIGLSFFAYLLQLLIKTTILFSHSYLIITNFRIFVFHPTLLSNLNSFDKKTIEIHLPTIYKLKLFFVKGGPQYVFINKSDKRRRLALPSKNINSIPTFMRVSSVLQSLGIEIV
jgi:hypothetical protein